MGGEAEHSVFIGHSQFAVDHRNCFELKTPVVGHQAFLVLCTNLSCFVKERRILGGQ